MDIIINQDITHALIIYVDRNRQILSKIKIKKSNKINYSQIPLQTYIIDIVYFIGNDIAYAQKYNKTGCITFPWKKDNDYARYCFNPKCNKCNFK